MFVLQKEGGHAEWGKNNNFASFSETAQIFLHFSLKSTKREVT